MKLDLTTKLECVLCGAFFECTPTDECNPETASVKGK